MQQHYQELGLQVGASEEDVREAFLALSRQYHPDLHGGDPGYEEKFKRVNVAYQQLKARGKAAPAQSYQQYAHQHSRRKGRATVGAYVFKKLTEIVAAMQEALNAGTLDQGRAVEQLYALFSPQVLGALQQERSRHKVRVIRRLTDFYLILERADKQADKRTRSFSMLRLHTLVDLITRGDPMAMNIRDRYFESDNTATEDTYHKDGVVTLQTIYYAVAIGVFFLFVLFSVLLSIKRTPCSCPTDFRVVLPGETLVP